jgi:choline dehydrogenase-like flavoprotein
VLWGTWSFRALPVDLRLRSHFTVLKQDEMLRDWGYAVADWPIDYDELEPFYNVTETLFAVCGDRKAFNTAVTETGWFKHFAQHPEFLRYGNWHPQFEFLGPEYPLTPVGHLVWEGMRRAGNHPVILPNALISPGSKGYETRAALQATLRGLHKSVKKGFWDRKIDTLWSDRTRDACNLCGYCGEYLCWGGKSPKSGTYSTTLAELSDLSNAEIRTSAVAYEVMYDSRLRRATGVRYLDIREPDHPRPETVHARNVIVSCGAIQSARLLRMSGPREGLGNAHDQLGRNAMFHTFGSGIKATLRPEFQGALHSEFGHTGNVTAFDLYFAQDGRPDAPKERRGKWCKAGTLGSAAKKNPLEGAFGFAQRSGEAGVELLEKLGLYTRTAEVRLTGDDLPMPENRVDLDPVWVDEYGLPVARITRDFGEHERWAVDVTRGALNKLFQPFIDSGAIIADADNPKISGGIVDLVGDHQLGTCRMGDDPRTSVVDRYCRVHEIENLFVVDSSIFPTGFGLNPMMTVVANALRVGTWIVQEMP